LGNPLDRIWFSWSRQCVACRLEFTKFSHANLEDVNLFAAKLINSTMMNTNFSGADLRNAKMCFLASNQIKLDGAKLEGARITILKGKSDFTSAEKQQLKERGAILSGSSELCY
jgi:uncharacterized protein YjbI with pentapeptide repeats